MSESSDQFPSSTGKNSQPQPWQFRWKRPRLEHVALGFDDKDGGGSKEFENIIHDDWVPISCASVVLTRDEARRAILELHQRDRLLVKKRKQEEQACEQEGKSGTRTPPKRSADNNEIEKNTPRNSNIKGRSVALLSPSSWFKKSSEGAAQFIDSQTKTTPDSKNNPSQYRRNKRKSNLNVHSPPASNIFTTFPNISPRRLEDSSCNEDRPPSPPIITDASTASSLLWEDNTLTSVSEEDAVAFRLYENSKLRQDDNANPSEPLAPKTSQEKRTNTKEPVERESFDSGGYYCDGHGNLRSRDFDEFDNVVLSVTVYATPRAEMELVDSTDKGCRPTVGEVVVMELLSTKSPPTLDSLAILHTGKQNRASSSSSSQSHLTPPPQGGESDSSAVSSALHSQHQSQINGHDDVLSTDTRILSRRILHWPSSIMRHSNKTRCAMYNGKHYSNEFGLPSIVSLGRTSTWKERTSNEKLHTVNLESDMPSSQLEVSQFLTRYDIQENRTADALDAIHCFNFLFGEIRGVASADAPTTNEDNERKSSVLNDNDAGKGVKKVQPLSLTFISNDGRVLFFNAMRVFLNNRKTNEDARDISQSFAAFIFGETLLSKVSDDVIPLSYPDATMMLSQLSSSTQPFLESADNDPSTWSRICACYEKKDANFQSVDVSDVDFEHSSTDWTRLIDFDASIDPLSLEYSTLPPSNVITDACTTTNSDTPFLAVCGKGLRRVHSRSSGQSHFRLGGFVTFVSLQHYNEVRTVYLSFAVHHIQPVFWNGLHYVYIYGEEGVVNKKTQGGRKLQNDSRIPIVMAIRVDSNQTNMFPGRFRPTTINLPSISESLGHHSRHFYGGDDTKDSNTIRYKVSSVSVIPSSPPRIVMAAYSTFPDSFVVVVNCSLSLSQCGSMSAKVRPGHRFCLRPAMDNIESGEDLNIWSTGGQGWSLIGFENSTNSLFYVSWEGTTDEGPYVLELGDLNSNVTEDNDRKQCQHCSISSVIPIMTIVDDAENGSILPDHQMKTSPFTSGYNLLPFSAPDQGENFLEDELTKRSCSLWLRESIISAAREERGMDEVLISVLDSISIKPDRSKPVVMSHEQKSKCILQHCSSWMQLDDTRANRGIVHGQVISSILRLGSHTVVLTLRTNVVTNPMTTPFTKVLSWLCQQSDYVTAAGVALSLLNDVEAVYELRGIPQEKCKDSIAHQGLLDGIQGLADGDVCVYRSLADMTVGCLIKGGVSMASTLEGFLSRNTLYDSTRASLMLVGTIASVISSEYPHNTQGEENNNNIVDRLSSIERPSDFVLWPIKCLLKMAVARNRLSSVLLLLNSTIPNELRWRQPKTRGLSTVPRPSLGVFLAAVEIILESSIEATRLFLNLYDEETGYTYWNSIKDDTRLVLCLFSVHGKHVLLQQPEVRAWILERLNDVIETPNGKVYNDDYLPDKWLCEIVSGVFYNAECEICLGLDVMKKSSLHPLNEDSECYRHEMISLQHVLISQEGSGGLDFDILIPCLLLLSSRSKEWRDGTSTSTQLLLNTVCDLAGRKSPSVPRFLFDGRTVMRQCALMENVQAAAFLVGGRSGLVLECADILMKKLGITMKNAEIALFGGSLLELKEVTGNEHSVELNVVEEDFSWSPSMNHRHILWLLQHHVLNISTYGDFESSPTQGEITPVVSGRICFRAWFCVTDTQDSSSATKWLETWLRRKLNLKDGVSPKRLACAALVRVLLWADEECSALDLNDCDDENDLMLASVIGFDIKFLAEISHACVGLIQSIPTKLQPEIISGIGNANVNTSAIFSFEVEGQHSLSLDGSVEL